MNRGKPPYKISSGRLIEGGKECAEQFSTAQTFRDSLLTIFDLSDGGLSPKGEYIKDSKRRIVFSTDNPRYVKLLRRLDKIGIIKLKIR